MGTGHMVVHSDGKPMIQEKNCIGERVIHSTHEYGYEKVLRSLT